MAARDTTFGFTDIAGSTAILRRLGEEAYDALLERHRELIRGALRAAGGQEVKTEGDGFFVAFADADGAGADAADAAMRFALGAQRALAAERWPVPLRVRMGFHRGPSSVRADGDYSSLAAHQAARVSAAAHGGQVLVTAAVVRDVDPPPETRFVHLGPHRLRDFDGGVELLQLAAPGIPDGFPPVRATREDHGLPLPRSSLVGREDELHLLRELLGTTPLITLHGPGGVGKTRLALEAAASMAASFPSGLHLVELSPISDPEVVVATVAAAIGVRAVPGQEPLDVLVAAMATGKRLLLLDSAERVLGAVAWLTETLLRACPECTILVTTTEPVRTPEERVVSVAPLPEEDGVRLLLQRSTARGADLGDGTGAITGGLATIAQRLDGIPLALELAAGRIADLGVDATVDGLDDRFSLLTNGWRTSLPRHRTLEAMVEWTVSLLDENERVLLRRLSTLAGRWRVADAIEVTAPGTSSAVVQQLVDRSLVSTGTASGGAGRLRLFDTVRAYMQAQLGVEESVALLDRKRRWLRDHLRKLNGEPDARIQSEIDELIPDLREVMSPSNDPGADAAAAGCMAEVAALTSAWFEARGMWGEAIARLEAAIYVAPPGPERLMAAATLAQHISLVGDMPRAVGLAREVLDDPATPDNARALAHLVATHPSEPRPDGLDPLEEAVRLAGDPTSSLALAARSRIAIRALTQGDPEQAADLLATVVVDARQHGRSVVCAQALGNRGGALLRLGRLDEAEASLREARDLSAAAGLAQLAASCLTNLSMLALFRGDPEAALELGEERLALSRQMGDVRGSAAAHVAIANAALALGDRLRARDANRLAYELFHKVDLIEGAATTLFNLAVLAEGDGDATEAARATRDLVHLVAGSGNPAFVTLALCAAGGLASVAGRPDGATLLAAMEQHRPSAINLDPSDLEWLSACASALVAVADGDALAEARARGATLDIDAAVALAMGVADELLDPTR